MDGSAWNSIYEESLGQQIIVSRTHNAATILFFGYVQFALAFVSGILLVPFILKQVGAESYGLWLACGEVLAYSAMVDFGVLGVLPWLIAAKDNKDARHTIPTLLSNALAAAILMSFAFVLVAVLVWHSLSSVSVLTEAQRYTVLGPLLLVAAGICIGFPLRMFTATLSGLQDVFFGGLFNIIQTVLNIALVILLLLKGYGLYALAAAAVFPPILTALSSLLRLKRIAPELLRGWDRPTFRAMFDLVKQGFGTWLGGFGWRMISASNGIIILMVATPEAAVVYVCTAKLGEILMHMAWQLTDSGLLGLAQLHGEGNAQRVREIITTLLRVTVVTSGGVALIVLIFNANFVTLWVGAEKFGGLQLSFLLALNFIAHSLVHILLIPIAVIGNRLQVGLLTILQGIFDIAAAVALGYAFGLRGIAASSLLSTTLIAFPLASLLLAKTVHLTIVDIWQQLLVPLPRIIPLIVIGTLSGVWISQQTLGIAIACTSLFGISFLLYTRRFITELPLPLKLKPWLVKARLIPEH